MFGPLVNFWRIIKGGTPAAVSGTVVVYADSNGKIILKQSDSSTATVATTADVTSASLGLWDDRGAYDASVNTYPASGGSGTSGAILKGDIWTISVAGTLGGSAVAAGDTVRALVDTPGQTATNWALAENNIGYVPFNIANIRTTFQATPDDTHVASEKLTKDSLDGKATSGLFCSAGSGLTLNFTAGLVRKDNVVTTVAAGSLTLADATTNYVEVNDAGTVSSNTSGFTSGQIALAVAVTSGGAITSVTDKRAALSFGVGDLADAVTKNGDPFAKTFSGSVTRAAATASATQAVTGVGFKPKRITFLAADDGAATVHSLGVAGDGADFCTYANTVADTVDATQAIHVESSIGDGHSADVTTYGTDGFTLNWTKIGNGRAITVNYIAEC
jgi:hypothetical protein